VDEEEEEFFLGAMAESSSRLDDPIGTDDDTPKGSSGSCFQRET